MGVIMENLVWWLVIIGVGVLFIKALLWVLVGDDKNTPFNPFWRK